jgi:hypothetical protein
MDNPFRVDRAGRMFLFCSSKVNPQERAGRVLLCWLFRPGLRIEARFCGALPISVPRRRGLPVPRRRGLPPTRRPCEAWTMRRQAYGGPARPSPLRGEALNAGLRYLEVTCGGCATLQYGDLTMDRDDRRRSIGFNLRAETFMRVRQAPHRALVNRAAPRLGQWRRSLARRC